MDDTTISDAREGRRGPVEGEQFIGIDRDRDRRPGSPMHAPPSTADGAPDMPPAEQGGGDERPIRASLERPTPVFGTAQPLHGVSGLIRKAAYGIPEHHARHWMLLMTADRVDVLEDRVGGLMAWPLVAMGADATADRIRSNPLPLLAGLATGAMVARRLSGAARR
jgi:hypothetical protein